MNIVDRFSKHLENILATSAQLAGVIGNQKVEPIHFLYALILQKGSVAAEVLRRLKIKPTTVEQEINKLPTIKKRTGGHVKLAENISFTPTCQQILDRALLLAEEHKNNYVGSEHLLTALVRANDQTVNEVFKNSKISLDVIKQQLDVVLNNASQFPRLAEVLESGDLIGEMMEPRDAQRPALPHSKRNTGRDSALDFFAANLTAAEWQKNLDTVIGREKEIERLIQIISRRTKNNPILLGEPGVGKTAIIEGLAKRIAANDVPEILLGKKIYALDMGLLVAGTSFRGEFESRLKQVMEEVAADPDIILFIDEIHNIVGAGSGQGTMDASNILKPALARGQVRCIGATTPAEFKKHIEGDAALERRFQPIFVDEPSPEETVKIIRGIKSSYEAHHQVAISDEAVIMAVDMSIRHLSGKFLPDKAIDLIDETAAAVRIKTKPAGLRSRLVKLKQELDVIVLKKETAAREGKITDALEWKTLEEDIRGKISDVEIAEAHKRNHYSATVTAADISDQVSRITGTKPFSLSKDRFASTDLKTSLKKRVIGQDEVVDVVANLIKRAELGLSQPHKPMASLLFSGPSGVGKTELAKQLATALYPGRHSLIKLDMSEYSEAFGVSKLLGSPAGYVGYKEANSFTDTLRVNPYVVILFDDIDKAHRDVTKTLLQMLEDGQVRDSTGRKISLKHAIIILTTTVGADEAARLGFGFDNRFQNAAGQSRLAAIDKLKEYFSPELINRLDEVCFFNTLSVENLAKVIALEIEDLNSQLTSFKTKIVVADKTLLSLTASQKNIGARELRRTVRLRLEQALADILEKKKIKSQYTIKLVNEQITLQ